MGLLIPPLTSLRAQPFLQNNEDFLMKEHNIFLEPEHNGHNYSAYKWVQESVVPTSQNDHFREDLLTMVNSHTVSLLLESLLDYLWVRVGSKCRILQSNLQWILHLLWWLRYCKEICASLAQGPGPGHTCQGFIKKY
ncbi:Hypothetical predicted protein [Podarcis lilfordi]|uniref:Uncharacterized protein n=1 Tax=Podarcis lilfordi TaxID=74358 RepID=A0AA35JR96_9SAUR|nr:Hypothetical predicted protein [Podarcis lilfordi]